MSVETTPRPNLTDEQMAEFEEMYRQHMPSVVGQLERKGAGADAEDLAQEAAIKAFLAMDRFDGQNPRAWLGTIATRTHIDSHRKRQVRPEQLTDFADPTTKQPAAGDRPEADAVQDLTVASLLDDLKQVLGSDEPGELRFEILMAQANGQQLAELAKELDMNPGTIGSNLYRARKQILKAEEAGTTHIKDQLSS